MGCPMIIHLKRLFRGQIAVEHQPRSFVPVKLRSDGCIHSLVILILGFRYNNGPADGPGGQRFHGPLGWVLSRSLGQGGIGAGQGALARAQIRSQALVISPPMAS